MRRLSIDKSFEFNWQFVSKHRDSSPHRANQNSTHWCHIFACTICKRNPSCENLGGNINRFAHMTPRYVGQSMSWLSGEITIHVRVYSPASNPNHTWPHGTSGSPCPDCRAKSLYSSINQVLVQTKHSLVVEVSKWNNNNIRKVYVSLSI